VLIVARSSQDFAFEIRFRFRRIRLRRLESDLARNAIDFGFAGHFRRWRCGASSASFGGPLSWIV
jgi:hypothetical protein